LSSKPRRRPAAPARATRGSQARAWDRPAAGILAGERWAIPDPPPAGPLKVLLAYPDDYPVAAASLGYQTIYRLLASLPAVEVDRAWLPAGLGRGEKQGGELRGVRTGRPAREFHLLAISMAYELEVSGLVRLLQLAGLPPRRAERGPDDPVVLLGGPITTASPALTYPFVDLLLAGEAEELLPRLIGLLDAADGEKEPFLRAAAELPVVLGAAAPGELPPLQRAPDVWLPAAAAWVSPAASFAGMFLVEAGRGCSRGCTYCVMSRSCSGGLRVAPASRVLAAIPPGTTKVGLVGAAVTDHPELKELVRACVTQGQQGGLSSLRADRLDEELVDLLVQGGLKTLTTALDGLSERLRRSLHRGTSSRGVLEAARLGKRCGIPRIKLYLMVGVPEEEEADLQEGIDLCREVATILPLTVTVSPFVPKPRTPLADAPFLGVKELTRRLDLLEQGLQGKVKLQAASARWAGVESRLAAGGAAAGEAALVAVARGGTLAAWGEALGVR